MENGWAQIISHPIRPNFPVDPVAIAAAAAATGTIIEVNLSTMRFIANSTPAAIGDDPMVRAMRVLLEKLIEHGGHFVLSSDSHHTSELRTARRYTDFTCRALGIDRHLALNQHRSELETALFSPRGVRAGACTDTSDQWRDSGVSQTEPWRGVVIDQSLTDPSIIPQGSIVGQNSMNLENEADRGEFTFYQVEIACGDVEPFLDEALAGMKRRWYLHLVNGDTMKLVYPQKLFTLTKSDDAGVQAAIDYGVEVEGIDPEQLGLRHLFDSPFD